MPDLLQSIVPMLSYEDGAKAMEWLCKVFGFSEKTKVLDENGALIHGEIELEGGLVMLATPSADYQSPKHHRETCNIAATNYSVPYIINGVLVYVEDVKAHFQHAVANGAVILSHLEEGGPGTRYRAEDPEGQRWMFMQKPM